MKKHLKMMSMLSLVIIMTFTMVGIAYADQATSGKTTETVYGHEYEFWSIISNDYGAGKLAAGTRLQSIEPSVPAGYMGTQIKLYDDDGIFYKGTKDFVYTTYKTGVTGSIIVYDVDENEFYYSQGYVALYQGDDYKIYRCKSTPRYMAKQATYKDSVEIQYNSHGEIFGSEFLLAEIGVKPDLILARGTNGELGYVKASELERNEISTPEEAIAYMESEEYKVTRTIPLYDCEGETVIGSFEFSFDDVIIIYSDEIRSE